MNFKINNKGFGIVEVLVASFIGLILVGALTRSSMSQLHFYNAIQSLFDEQDLAYAMGEVLTNPLSCKANLKPSRLNPGNGDMTDLVQGLNDPDVQDMSLVTAGTKFKSLSIVKISLSGSGDPQAQTVGRDVTVYFNRKGIRTRDNKPCSSTDTSGCYATRCILKYRVSSSDVTVCDVQTCAGIKGGSNLSGTLCNSGEYLRGFSSNGNKVCETLPTSLVSRRVAQQSESESPPEQQPEPESPPEQQPELSPSMERPELPKTPECMRARRQWPYGPLNYTGEYSENCGVCVKQCDKGLFYGNWKNYSKWIDRACRCSAYGYNMKPSVPYCNASLLAEKRICRIKNPEHEKIDTTTPMGMFRKVGLTPRNRPDANRE